MNTSNVGFNEIENRLTELEDHVRFASPVRLMRITLVFEGSAVRPLLLLLLWLLIVLPP